jgi:hypothetical protein
LKSGRQIGLAAKLVTINICYSCSSSSRKPVPMNRVDRYFFFEKSGTVGFKLIEQLQVQLIKGGRPTHFVSLFFAQIDS